jgi:hypothetical protein
MQPQTHARKILYAWMGPGRRSCQCRRQCTPASRSPAVCVECVLTAVSRDRMCSQCTPASRSPAVCRICALIRMCSLILSPLLRMSSCITPARSSPAYSHTSKTYTDHTLATYHTHTHAWEPAHVNLSLNLN